MRPEGAEPERSRARGQRPCPWNGVRASARPARQVGCEHPRSEVFKGLVF